MSARYRDLQSRVEEGQDIIDPRDVEKRIDELEGELAPPDLDCECAERLDDDGRRTIKPEIATCGACGFQWCDRCNPTPAARCHNEEGHDEERRGELGRLKALWEDIDQTSDEALIADHYFEQYAQELAEDIGALPKDAGWPAGCIDWTRAAKELQQDYSSVQYGATTYWQRS